MRLSQKVIVAAALMGLFTGTYTEAKPASKIVKQNSTITAKIEKNANNIDKLIEYENYAEADRILSNMLKSSPNDITLRSLSIVSAAKQGHLDIAQAQIDVYLPKYSANANLHYAQGIVNIKRQASSDMDYRNNTESLIKDAIKEFNTAIKLNPNHSQAYNALGVVALNTGNLDKAREYFNKALNIDPNYATAIDNLGTVDYVEGKYDDAQKKFLKTLTINPKSSTAYFHLAQVYDKKSLYSKALDALDHSLRLKSNSSVAYNLRGEILKKQGNEAAAIESFKKSIAVKPENTAPYMNLASIYEKRFDNELAIANLKSALAVNPSLNSAKLYIADLSLLSGNYKEALKYYSSLVGVENYNADALKGMANAYFEQTKDTVGKSSVTSEKELKTAYDNIELAIQANPQDLNLYLAKLKLAKLTGQKEVTAQTLSKIIDAPARGLNDMLAKGDAYYAMNRYRDAKNMFEKALVFAQSPEDYLMIAEILTYDKFYPSAKDVLRKILVYDPSNEEAMHNLQYIMTMEKQSESLYKDAKFFDKQDKNKVFAREYALRSLEYNPTNYEAALLSAKLCEKQKHYEEAVDAYKVVAGLELKPKKVKKYLKKIKKLNKKIKKINNSYMKKEEKNFKEWQNKLTPSL